MLKKYRNRSVWLSVLFSFGIMASLLMPLRITAQSQNSAINGCIPDFGVVRTEMIGSTRLNGVDYYLLISYEQNDGIGSDLIISVTGGKCEVAFWNPMGDWVPFASSVPQSVARQLSLVSYQHGMRQVGRAEFERQVRQVIAQGEVDELFDEDIWALEQLGFDVQRRQ